MRGDLARESGVTYSEEGTHTFKLRSGASFRIYVSPYQPKFGDWAFPYEADQDRFNLLHQVLSIRRLKVKSTATNPIPDFGKDRGDIIMTHGPSYSILDKCNNGNVGCHNLLQATSRARPLLHCFGHVHEGYGAQVIKWEEDRGVFGEQAIAWGGRGTPQMNAYSEFSNCLIKAGRETLMINAAIMNEKYLPYNAPWLVDLDLPRELLN
jgi:hypothetical protein